MTGCGASVVAGKGLDASAGVFTASPNSVNFGSVNIGTSANNTVSLQNSSSDPIIVSNLSVSGDPSFSLVSQVQLPFTMAPGSTTALKVSYLPTGVTADSGNLVVSSNSMILPTANIRLQGHGTKPTSSNPAPVLTAFSCTSGSLTGVGADTCSVTLGSAAPEGGFSVGLASSNAAVYVPASVIVPANATTAGFTATASAVPSAASATLTASAGGTTKTFALQLQPESSPTAPNLTVSAASLAFGSVALNTAATQTLTLTSSGSSPLIINAATLSGTGFTMPGATFPATLNPGQTVSLTVQFDPTTAGAASGQIQITSNSANGIATVAVSGTGTKTSTPTLSLSAPSLSFGSVTLNKAAQQTLTLSSSGSGPLTINSATLTGTGFTMSGATFPTTLNPGQTASLTVQFDPTTAGAASGQIAISSNSSTGSSAIVGLSGTGSSTPVTAALSALSCTSSSMTGAGTDTCTVSLSTAAPSGGLSVTLASSNKAVTLPASVNVPANATSAGFSATVSAVSSAQSATLTATANGISKNFALQLSTASGATLSINASSIAFGNVSLNTPATQSVTLTATGTSPVIVGSATVTGNGFSLSGAKLPMTVNPGTPATLSVQFDPTSAGAVTGQLNISDNSTNNANANLSLTGTGSALQIALNWDAPGSTSDPVTGYNVYRAVSGSSSYQVVKSDNSQTSYTDSSIQAGTTYQYYVTSLDSAGAESTPSNTATVAVP